MPTTTHVSLGELGAPDERFGSVLDAIAALKLRYSDVVIEAFSEPKREIDSYADIWSEEPGIIEWRRARWVRWLGDHEQGVIVDVVALTPDGKERTE